jgi:phosphatidylglycerophosphate synthase
MNILLSSEKSLVRKQSTLEEIRKVTLTGKEAPVHRLAGQISPHLSWVFLRWNVAPNTITFIFIGCLILASVVLALHPTTGVQIVALLIIASYILDCCDGPVARVSKRTSTIGDKLDMLGHWFTNNLLIIGATLGEIGSGGSNSAWLIGMIAMMGTNTYYYMQYHLLPHSSPKIAGQEDKREDKTSLLKRIRSIFHVFAPLDTNLIILASLIGLPFLAIQVWAVISNVAILAIFGQYYWRETHQG